MIKPSTVCKPEFYVGVKEVNIFREIITIMNF